jgi:2-polyprenyl-6-methoxyphenol hydroxylase-like FAD-dependent oxidoreductase
MDCVEPVNRRNWTIRQDTNTCSNGRSGKEIHRREKPHREGKRSPIRTQRTKLQSTLLSHVDPKIIHLSKKLTRMEDLSQEGVILYFKDGTSATADLVVGADGIRSVYTSTFSLPQSAALTELRSSEILYGRTIK